MMYAESLLPTLEGLARRAADAAQVELAWVEFKRQGKSWVLRVFVDRRDAPVSLADCERVSERLSLLLDVEDPIESSYTLEVSTPGLDRPLRGEEDYRRFRGRLARLRTKQPWRGRRSFSGRLDGVSNGAVQLLADGERLAIPIEVVEKGRLEIELFAPPAPSNRGTKARKHA